MSSAKGVRGPALACAAALLILVVLLVTVSVSAESALWKLVLTPMVLGLPAALGATRHPHNPVGWLLLGVALVFACSALATQWVEGGHLVASGWAVWVADRASAALVPLTVLALVLLPTGTLPSPRWRPAVTAAVAAQSVLVLVWAVVSGPAANPDSSWPVDPTNPVGLAPSAWAGVIEPYADWVLQLPLLLGVVAVGLRLREQRGRRHLAALLGGTAGFVLLVLLGHALWPVAAQGLDVLGSALLAAGLTATLLHVEPVAAPPAGPVDAPGLSAREREVLGLVAQGLTNRQIADALVISPITARNHVGNILTKLGLQNRTQAAAWVGSRSSR